MGEYPAPQGPPGQEAGQAFTKLIREITVAARIGGGDINANPRLRLAVDKAKAQSMPKDNIERAVKRGAGETDGADYLEIRYEGYPWTRIAGNGSRTG